MARSKKMSVPGFKGVRFYEDDSKQYRGNSDRYYSIRYRLDGSLKEEGIGWASEGWTPQKALDELYRIKLAVKDGKKVRTRGEKREAREKEAQAERERLEQERKERITFNEIWDQYFVQAQNNKKKGSWRREKSLYINWIKPTIGQQPINDVAPIHLEHIKKKMKRAGLADSTVKYALATIRQVFNWAKNNSLFEGDSPIKKVKIPKVDNQRVRFLTAQEAANILELLPEHNRMVYEITLLSLDHGLRKGEVFKLEWGDIDLDHDRMIIKDTKSGKSRHAFLTRRAANLLREKGPGSPSELIFPTEYDNKCHLVTKHFNAVVNELGLNDGVKDSRQKVVFHTLRHTFASWQVMGGTPLAAVRDLLGHCNLTMVSRYAHLADEHMQQSVSVIERNVVSPTVMSKNSKEAAAFRKEPQKRILIL